MIPAVTLSAGSPNKVKRKNASTPSQLIQRAAANSMFGFLREDMQGEWVSTQPKTLESETVKCGEIVIAASRVSEAISDSEILRFANLIAQAYSRVAEPIVSARPIHQ